MTGSEDVAVAQPARPLLASHLLDLEQLRRKRFGGTEANDRLSTGCSDIDKVLGGNGVERGIVVGISAESGDARLISLNLLASILVSHLPNLSEKPFTKASIIDTTGGFPLQFLASILKARIAQNRASGKPPDLNATSEQKIAEAANINADVTICLEMVGISRVFDIEGLWEVLSELSRSPTVPARPRASPKASAQTDGQKSNEAEIADSEDESEYPVSPNPSQTTSKTDEGVEIIIIDNMSQIINELFSRKERSDAHSLLTLLSKTLTTQAQTSNILTILHNNLVPSTPSTTYTHRTTDPSANPYNFINPHDRSTSRSSTRTPSLFPSNPVKPALGQIFTQFPSLHLFLSSLPKTTRDAEILYTSANGTGVKYCTVLEVLTDSTPASVEHPKPFAYREGRWCALEANTQGTAFRPAFEVKGDRKGMAMERVKKVLGEKIGMGEVGLGREGEEGVAGAERLTGRGVSNVAKIYGFGGRRV